MGLFDIFKKNKSSVSSPARASTAHNPPTYVPPVPPSPSPKPSYRSIFDVKFDGKTLKYKYEDVDIAMRDLFPDAKRSPGQTVMIIHDPDNAHDEKAMLVAYLSDTEQGYQGVGYMYKNKLQEMAYDWFYKEWTCIGQITHFDEHSAKMNLAFFVPN